MLKNKMTNEEIDAIFKREDLSFLEKEHLESNIFLLNCFGATPARLKKDSIALQMSTPKLTYRLKLAALLDVPMKEFLDYKFLFSEEQIYAQYKAVRKKLIWKSKLYTNGTFHILEGTKLVDICAKFPFDEQARREIDKAFEEKFPKIQKQLWNYFGEKDKLSYIYGYAPGYKYNYILNNLNKYYKNRFSANNINRVLVYFRKDLNWFIDAIKDPALKELNFKNVIDVVQYLNKEYGYSEDLNSNLLKNNPRVFLMNKDQINNIRKELSTYVPVSKNLFKNLITNVYSLVKTDLKNVSANLKTLEIFGVKTDNLSPTTINGLKLFTEKNKSVQEKLKILSIAKIEDMQLVLETAHKYEKDILFARTMAYINGLITKEQITLPEKNFIMSSYVSTADLDKKFPYNEKQKQNVEKYFEKHNKNINDRLNRLNNKTELNNLKSDTKEK